MVVVTLWLWTDISVEVEQINSVRIIVAQLYADITGPRTALPVSSNAFPNYWFVMCWLDTMLTQIFYTKIITIPDRSRSGTTRQRIILTVERERGL